MIKIRAFSILLLLLLWACEKTTQEDRRVRKPTTISTHIIKESEMLDEHEGLGPLLPIHDGSFALRLNNKMVYVDPMGPSTMYDHLPEADVVLVTHYHPDYLVPSAIEALAKDRTTLLVPSSVRKNLPGILKEKAEVLEANQDTSLYDIEFKALKAVHAKSTSSQPQEANGFLIQTANQRIFVSGKTEHLSEISAIKDIDIALIRMNIKDALSLEETIDKIVALKPKKVIPYYYQGNFLYSYVARLKHQVEKRNPAIEVEIINWYKHEAELDN